MVPLADDHAVARDVPLLHAEVDAAMLDEHVHLLEGAGVDEDLDALASRQLAATMLQGDTPSARHRCAPPSRFALELLQDLLHRQLTPDWSCSRPSASMSSKPLPGQRGEKDRASTLSLTVDKLCRPGLGPLSFSIADGQCAALMGPSGSGKSLLLRAIADLDPSDGRVAVGDTMREHVTTRRPWRRLVGLVPAESGWWCETVGEHLAAGDEALAMITAIGLPAESVGWPVGRLSTGERQRLALVRALLLLAPRVLLLDEPHLGVGRGGEGGGGGPC